MDDPFSLGNCILRCRNYFWLADYYAYRKVDSCKLKKKYIGKYYPPVENTNKANSSHMDHACSDTVIVPSNNGRGLNDGRVT
jgi:hypothetical protein